MKSNSNPHLELEWVISKLRSKGTECEKTLIYFSSTQRCQKVYNTFLHDLGREAYTDGGLLMMEMFHAKHKPETKESILTSFKKVGSHIRVLFSTVAFGMGVQIPDVDVVIHYGLPENLLTYWQETGRCARDHGRVGTSIIYPFGISVSKCTDEVMQKVAKREKCIRELVMDKFAIHGHQNSQYADLVRRNFCDGNCRGEQCRCLRCTCCSVCNFLCPCPKKQPNNGIPS